MDLDAVKHSLEPAGSLPAAGIPAGFFDFFAAHGLSIDLIEHGHIICSMTAPPSLLNSSGVLQGGLIATLVDVVGSAVFLSAGCPTSGVSIEISISYFGAAFLDEEIEFDSRVLRIGKTIAVSTIEVRKKKDKKIIAHARHAKYLVVPSKI